MRAAIRPGICLILTSALGLALTPPAAAQTAAETSLDVVSTVTETPPRDDDAMLRSGDLDGDGDLDLVTGSTTGVLTAWLQQPEGWSPREITRRTDDVRPVAVADLDGDGDGDVVASTRGSLRVFHNGTTGGGDAGLWFPTEIEDAGRAPDDAFFSHGEVVPADLDGDGDTDLVLSPSFANEEPGLIWLANDGTGRRWTRHVIDETPEEPEQIEVADLDGDGDADVITFIDTPDLEGVFTHRNDGGTWTRAQLPVPVADVLTFTGFSFAVADADGDGAAEVYTPEEQEGDEFAFDRLTRYTPDPSVTSFTRAVVSEPLLITRLLTSADAGARPELFVTGVGGVVALSPTGPGSWSPLEVSDPATVRLIGPPAHPADVDGDGRTDVVTTTDEADLVVLRDPGTASGPWPTVFVDRPATVYPSVSTTGDIDGDGTPDVVTATDPRSDRLVWFSEEGGTWRPTPIDDDVNRQTPDSRIPAVSAIPLGTRDVEAVDVDGDGDLDVVTLANFISELVVFENLAGDGTTWERRVIDVQGSVDDGFIFVTFGDIAQGLVAEDLDGDGDVDLAVAGQIRLWAYANDGTGTTWTRSTVTELTEEEASDGALMSLSGLDVDDDADTDLVMLLEDQLIAYVNDGTGSFAERVLAPAPVDAPDLATITPVETFTGDLDGDGRTDLVARQLEGAALTWFPNAGTGAWTGQPLPWPQPDWLAIDDLDGDGDDDVVTVTDGQALLRRNDGGGTFAGASLLLDAADLVHAHLGDADGDGALDLVTTSRSDGRVQVSTAAPRPTDPLTAAVQFSRARFAEPGSAAWGILSRDDVFADTLAATSLAGYGPLLFTPTGALDPATAAELARTVPAGGTVYLLGGEAALSPAVEQAVRDLGLTPVRLAGASRLDTAVAVADEVARVRGTDLVDQVLLARAGAPADNPTAAWADSVAGGGPAAAMRVPVLLRDTASLWAPPAAGRAAP
ncbi:FG-GAP-like repeat-containing protein, partial [Euzebya sp.]|uniref:FG-GAP-like repeat-containing protein n=1 Tax=Euzebya sp. TaxID=1971409 RepID=UPI003515F2B1